MAESTENDTGKARFRAGARAVHPADLLAPLVLVAIAALYFWRLDAWLINDDEGSYLYAAWRISLGEMPYRDFLTPQLPAFLIPGGVLMKLAGAYVLPARALAATLTLGAGMAVWATSRRLFGAWVGLLAGALLLLHPDVYLECRTFRPEPFMLFYVTIAFLLFARGALTPSGTEREGGRLWLVSAGLFFGLASLSKLFGVLPLVGCLAWLLVTALQRRKDLRGTVLDLLAVGASAALVVLIGLGAFYVTSTQVYAAVLGHHLQQGAGLGLEDVFRKGIDSYATYLRFNSNALLIFVALVVAGLAWRDRDRAVELFGWQLPTLLVFLIISRELWPRHLIYVLPAAVTLFAVGVRHLATGDQTATAEGQAAPVPSSILPWLAGALVAALIVPWALIDRDSGWRWEDGTERLSDLIAELTAPDEYVLSDYSELNFYAGRPTTYSGASLSAGAAGSGQITWGRLAGELSDVGVRPELVVVDRTQYGDQEYGHLRFLHDLQNFEAWLGDGYELAGQFRRDPQHYLIYTPNDRPLPMAAQFEKGPTLLKATVPVPSAGPGESIEAVTLWRSSDAPMDELVSTLRLVDAAGIEWAQSDEALRGSGQRPTSLWTADELSSDRLLLEVPYGTPPGQYELRLGLYDRHDLSGLEAVGSDGRPLGQSLPIGQVEIEPHNSGLSDAGRLPIAHELEMSGDGLQLLGRGALPLEPVDAGTVVPLDLWWLVEGGGRPPDVSVTAHGKGSGSSGETPGAHGNWRIGVPGHPVESWPSGKYVVRQQLLLPVRAAATGDYDLHLYLDEPYDGPSTIVRSVVLGTLSVVGRDLSDLTTVPPAHEHSVDATFGNVARLIGADAPTTADPGEIVTTTLIWEALAPTATSFKVSVQLVSEAGDVVAQHDSEPADWTRPTTGWLPGEIILDDHTFALPDDVPPGQYELVALMYESRTLLPLPAIGDDAVGDAAVLNSIEVGES